MGKPQYVIVELKQINEKWVKLSSLRDIKMSWHIAANIIYNLVYMTLVSQKG